MTYNFDPEQWYETQVRLLNNQLDSGEIDRITYGMHLKDLEKRFNDMVERLQGTYSLPPSKES